jgi:hypothetical protein
MVDTRPNTPWAVASLGCGLLASLGAVVVMVLPAFSYLLQQEPTGVSGGIAVCLLGSFA